MYSYRWAKFLIAGARYNDSQVLLVELYIHRESDGSIKPGVCRNRPWGLSHLVNGSTLFTLNQNNNKWQKKDRIILNQVAGRYYIRTHPSPHPGDDISYHFTQGCMI